MSVSEGGIQVVHSLNLGAMLDKFTNHFNVENVAKSSACNFYSYKTLRNFNLRELLYMFLSLHFMQ